jgi:hypothetical protein
MHQEHPMSAIQASLCPAAGLATITPAEANRLLTDWGHYLGPCRRPFGTQAWLLDVAGTPISVAISASTVSTTAAGYPRLQLVELARLCTNPDHRWATRPMLRLWREIAGPAWPYWPVHAAIAYSANGRHDGGLYRFDGWTRVRSDAGHPSGPGATWSTYRDPDHPAAGAKTLWLWEYPA